MPSSFIDSKRPLIGRIADYGGLVIVLVLLVALFSSLSQHFFSRITFITLANQIPALTVIAVGMTYVLIIAGIDLSVGSVMALGGAVLGLVVTNLALPLWIGLLACLLAGLVCGFLNGFITVKWAIPSFIVTLGMLEIARGSSYIATSSRTVYIGSVVDTIGSPLNVIGLSPAFLLALIVVIVGQVILSYTVFGRYIVAIGTNETAVNLSGIDSRPLKIIVFTISGFLAGLGGLFHVGYLQSVDPNAGTGLELSAIAAVVIGGTSLMGGRGSVINSFIGVLIISVLQLGLAQAGATEPTKRLITGVVIIAAVIADVYRNRLVKR